MGAPTGAPISHDPPSRSAGSPVLTIVIIHGRGVSGPDETWPMLVQEVLTSVAGTPESAESQRFREARILAPSYAFLTQERTEPSETLETVITFPVTSMRRWSRVERSDLAGNPSISGKRLFGDISILWGATGMKDQPRWDDKFLAELASSWLPDFQAYLNHRETNDGVRNLVLNEIPSDGDLIIVRHSMGSLVALDVLHDLPESVRVRGLITIGSPLAYPGFHKLIPDDHLQRAAGRAPFWVNILDPSDQVTGGSAVSKSWPVAEHAVDVPVSNAAVGARPFGEHSATWYLQQPAFGVALHRMIVGPPTRPAWDPVEELNRVRFHLKGLESDDASFRSRIRAIIVAQKKRLGPHSKYRSTEFFLTPKAGFTLNGVVFPLSWLAAAMWSPTGIHTEQMKNTLNVMIGDLPFQRFVGMVLGEADLAGAALVTELPGYCRLPPESEIWDRIRYPSVVLMSRSSWLAGPFGRSDPHDMNFLFLLLMIQARVHVELTGTLPQNLSATFSSIRRDVAKSQPGTVEHHLGVIAVQEFERLGTRTR